MAKIFDSKFNDTASNEQNLTKFPTFVTANNTAIRLVALGNGSRWPYLLTIPRTLAAQGRSLVDCTNFRLTETTTRTSYDDLSTDQPSESLLVPDQRQRQSRDDQGKYSLSSPLLHYFLSKVTKSIDIA